MAKNILIIITSLSYGGAQRVVSNLSMALSQNHHVFLLLFNPTQIDYPFGGELIRFNSPSASHPFIQLLQLLPKVIETRKIKQDKKIDVSISLLQQADYLNILSQQKDKVIISPRIYRSKNDASKGIYGIFFKYLTKLLYQRADEIIAVSKGVAQDLSDHFGLREDKMKVIYNLYEPDKIFERSQETLDERHHAIFNYPSIINVGRLVQQKGQWHLIRAFKKVKESIPKAKLVILGEGELREYLKSLAEGLAFKVFSEWEHPQYGLENYDIYFFKYQANPFKFIARATVLAFPSLWEGLSNVIVEAMACRTPVVVSDCKAGSREILAPDTDFRYATETAEFTRYGILMPVCNGKFYTCKDPLHPDELQWAEMLIRLLKDQGLRLRYAEAGQRRAFDFKTEKILQEWLKTLALDTNSAS